MGFKKKNEDKPEPIGGTDHGPGCMCIWCRSNRSRAAQSAAKTTHGHTGGRNGKASPTYGSWANMLTRCYNRERPQWKDYGGRGITVCDRWRESFENFLADMGERPDGMWLDRINNDGQYEPGNCQWSTPKEQNNNRRKLPAEALSKRSGAGWTPERRAAAAVAMKQRNAARRKRT